MFIIFKKFYTLEPEKQQRIINAALKEFAKNGYERASTNEIIKEADISKGSLFNYFKSKRELYFYLIDYVAEIIEKIYDEIDLSVTDFFERIREVGVIKYNIMKKTPQAFDFINTLGKEESAEVKSDINKKGKSIVENGFARIYENIDFSKFRDDIDLEKTLNIINWTMLSFSEQQRDRLNSFKDIEVEILKEWDDYFDIMKRCFYK
ncbi:TetR/AcrR family transcriptional regulator [Sedimentibacter sp. MB31-C6]|uniref:TetR/AcrR family transcriptional regulator n=1 Tax=Sedimentibacter sp. MB31-C6 TaxID=3109366 RepID=UPI002DDCB686|nr:TetR/AcrR family transcriptional regulator [Sedimentibacter sp. MB36-C1]WSI05293.1 TetR/AcrR family transcriptional regulator [Sedimentibacter sp. MB36-C1]